jgi:tetratricopeptide (TPR) repeat protein
MAPSSQEVEGFCRQAKVWCEERRFDAAARLYEQTLGLPLAKRDRGRVLALLSRLLQRVYGGSERALGMAQEAVSLLENAGETPEVWALRGISQGVAALSVAFRNGPAATVRARQALADLERAADRAVDPEVYGMGAEMCLLLEEPQSALPWGERYVAVERDEGARAAFAGTMARAYRMAGRLEEADRTLTEALFRLDLCKYAAATLYHEQGQLYRVAGRPREARVALERAVGAAAYEDQARTAELRVSLGELCYDEGNFVEAAEQFERALALVPEDLGWRRYGLIWLGRCRVEVGACEQARECFAEVLASPEASEEEQMEAQRGALYAEAQQFYQAGDFRTAAKAYHRILEQNPADDEFRRTMLLWLADCCVRLDDPVGARACYEEILASSQAVEGEKQRALADLARLPPAGRTWVH